MEAVAGATCACMEPAIEGLFADCEQVLRGDPALLGKLREQGFICQQGCWDFALPELHRWLCGQGHLAGLEYGDFLRQLYASELNARLALLGAQIVVVDNRGKLNQRLYRLQRRV